VQPNRLENLDALFAQAEHYANGRVVPDDFEIRVGKSSAEISLQGVSKITPWRSILRMDGAVGRISNRFSL